MNAPAEAPFLDRRKFARTSMIAEIERMLDFLGEPPSKAGKGFLSAWRSEQIEVLEIFYDMCLAEIRARKAPCDRTDIIRPDGQSIAEAPAI